MKKKILYLAAILICLSIITGGTMAYFTAEDTVRNEITSGGIQVRVVEQQLADGQLRPSEGQSIPVMPATTVSRIVSVQSLRQSAWVRVRYSVTVYDSQGQILDIPPEDLEKAIVIQPDGENWSLKDGWWYCNTAISAGETTSPLFRTVTFSGEEMGNEYQNCTAVLEVTAQAVQQANNGASVLEAQGWPAD